MAKNARIPYLASHGGPLPQSESLTSRRLYLIVAAAALVPYLRSLGLGFALDDVPIIATNPLVHRWSGVLQAFRSPYWPVAAGAAMYRPLALASFALDWQTGQPVGHSVRRCL